MTNFDLLRFQHPFTAIISGPTGSGKTVLTRNVLQDFKNLTTIKKDQLKVTWCYGQWQETYNKQLPNVFIEHVEGLISEQEMEENRPDVIVIDDLMSELAGDKRMTNLFTKVSHHRNISIIFIVQNIFHQAKEMRTISLNSHYFFLLKNPRDKMQVQAFGRQMFPDNIKYFMEAYEDATIKPFSYLLVDLYPTCPENHRLRSRITTSETIKHDYSPIVYLPK